MQELPGVENLSLFESRAVVPMTTFAPGTYTKRLSSAGNSLLSSLFVAQLDSGASVSVSFWDAGLGEPGERYNLGSHTLITSAQTTDDRTLITKLHNKPNIEITITGGSATLGLYLTVVQSFASDLDSALKREEQVVSLVQDKAIPITTYDQTLGQFFMLRSERGYLPFTVSESGTLWFETHSLELDPSLRDGTGLLSNVLTLSLPLGLVERKFTQFMLSIKAIGSYFLYKKDALNVKTLISFGRFGPACPNITHAFNPRYNLLAGDALTLDIRLLGAGVVFSSSPVSCNLLFTGSDF